MRSLIIFAAAIASTMAATPSLAQYNDGSVGYDSQQYGNRPYDYRHFDYNRPDPRYGDYSPERYYSDAPQYHQRALSRQDRIYRGRDNRYYCRRNDGTTGTVVGALSGGLLGNLIAPHGSKLLGTILGGGGGALIGRSVGRHGNRNVMCR
jgi:hypothetical protein